MKRIITLSLLLATCSMPVLNAQNKGVLQDVNLKNTDVPFKMHFNKKLSVAAHTKSGAAVTHSASDFVLFNQDGTYQHAFAGTQMNGTWKYLKASNEVEITTSGIMKFTVTEASQTKLILTSGVEVLTLMSVTSTTTTTPVVIDQSVRTSDKVITDGTQTVEAKKVEAPFSMHYNVKMKIGVHKVNNVAVAHAGTDYVIFNKDGSYEQKWSGVVSKGTWSYDAITNLVKVSTKVTNEYKVTEATADRLILETGKEYISLFPIK